MRVSVCLHTEFLRRTDTYDVLKYAFRLPEILAFPRRTDTYDVLKYPNRYIVYIYSSGRTDTYDVLKLVCYILYGLILYK